MRDWRVFIEKCFIYFIGFTLQNKKRPRTFSTQYLIWIFYKIENEWAKNAKCFYIYIELFFKWTFNERCALAFVMKYLRKEPGFARIMHFLLHKKTKLFIQNMTYHKNRLIKIARKKNMPFWDFHDKFYKLDLHVHSISYQVIYNLNSLIYP